MTACPRMAEGEAPVGPRQRGKNGGGSRWGAPTILRADIRVSSHGALGAQSGIEPRDESHGDARPSPPVAGCDSGILERTPLRGPSNSEFKVPRVSRTVLIRANAEAPD
ncbi:hypothetical protein GCM10022245_44990 [Streptomyces mayteni]